MNQVEFLGLAHTFATCNLVMINAFWGKPAHKKVRMLEWRLTNFTVVREVLCNNYRSCNLIGPYHFLGISPRNLTSFTRPFLTGRRAQARHESRHGSSFECYFQYCMWLYAYTCEHVFLFFSGQGSETAEITTFLTTTLPPLPLLFALLRIRVHSPHFRLCFKFHKHSL